ncbi:MAG: hypothetical protein AAFO69_11880 [Bacteroidota bacterium]
MKKQHLFLLVGLLIWLITPQSTFAQDLVVTINGDSLNVEIIKVTETHVKYAYRNGKKVERVNQPKSEITAFQYIFFSETRTLEYIFDPNDITFRFAFGGGPSWGLDGPPEDASDFFKDYAKKVNSGWFAKGEISFFMKNRIGVGAVYDHFFTKESIDNVLFIDNITNDTITGTLADDVKINYLGPQISYHVDTGIENFTLFLGAGIGHLWYRDDFLRVDPFTAIGRALGYHLSASADFIMMENVLVGFEVSGTFGTVENTTLIGNNGTQVIREPNDISRINVSIGLRIMN